MFCYYTNIRYKVESDKKAESEISPIAIFKN